MQNQAIETIKAAGFKFYSRLDRLGRPSTYGYYTDGTRIGYVEFHPYRGFSVSTCHRPNRFTGTGFQYHRDASELTPAMLEDGLRMWPPGSWTPSERESVHKWKDWSAFATVDSWNAGLVDM